MEEDIRLNAQLKSLGKKLFQFRDLIAKLDIPESMPPPPHDREFWDVFVSKCTSAVTVLKQVHAALTPDMYHLSVFPGDKIWRTPAAVPDLLSMPEFTIRPQVSPIAHSQEQISEWNTALEEANQSLDEMIDSIKSQSSTKSTSKKPDANTSTTTASSKTLDMGMINSLMNSTSRDRTLAIRGYMHIAFFHAPEITHSGMTSTTSAFGFRYAHENPFSMEYSCGICSRCHGDEDLDSMILCEGGCKRIFHMECIGLSSLPDGAASKWACSRCVQRLKSCHVCDGVEPAAATASTSSSAGGSLVKCKIPYCGKNFHTSCFSKKFPHHENTGGVCPLHACAAPSCTEGPITDESYFCILCLTSYHLKCMPEEIEIICENVSNIFLLLL